MSVCQNQRDHWDIDLIYGYPSKCHNPQNIPEINKLKYSYRERNNYCCNGVGFQISISITDANWSSKSGNVR